MLQLDLLSQRMIIMLVTMDREGNCRTFGCYIPNLESAFDAANAVAATGDVLVSVDLIDNRQRTRLPTEAFDGEPMRANIEKLENEWLTILT